MLRKNPPSIKFPKDGEVHNVKFERTNRGIEGGIGFACRETHFYPQRGFMPEEDSLWQCRLHKKTEFLYFCEPLKLVRSKNEHDASIMERMRTDVFRSLVGFAKIQQCLDLFGDQITWTMNERAAELGFSEEEINQAVMDTATAWFYKKEKPDENWIAKNVAIQLDRLVL